MPSRLTIIKLSCRSRWRSQKTNRIPREVLRRARGQTLEKRAPLNEVSQILALLIFKGIVALPQSGNFAVHGEPPKFAKLSLAGRGRSFRFVSDAEEN